MNPARYPPDLPHDLLTAAPLLADVLMSWVA
jgi:hypothetical protein